jgi:soluble lytic murein transglycosylase
MFPMKLQNLSLLVLGGILVTWVSCSTLVPALRGPGASPLDPAAEFASPAIEALPSASELPPLPSPEQRDEGVQALRRGLELTAAGDAAGAALSFERAAVLMPAFADWAHVLAARAFAEVGSVAETRRRLESVGAGAAGEVAWRAHQHALLQAGDTAAAIRLAEESATEVSMPSERALAWSSAGTLRVTRGERADALDALRRAMQASRQSPGALAAARAAHDLPDLGADDRLLVGRTLLGHGGIDRAIPMIESYLAHPAADPDARAEVRIEAGRALFNARRYDLAERVLRGAEAEIPEAGFLLSRSRYRAGQQSAGMEGFAAVARNHPGTPSAANALFLLGDLAHDAGRISAAREFYRQAVVTGVHNVSATDAVVRLAGIAILAGDASTALLDLNTYLAERPRDPVSAPAVYWLGRTQLMLGDEAQARQRFQEVLELDPFSYYGMLAAGRLGTNLRVVQLPDPPPVDPAAAASLEHVFFRIDVLQELGLNEEGDFELARLQEQVGEDHGTLYTLAEGMSARGQPIAGALLGRRIHQMRGQWDDRLLRIVFQFPFQDIVIRESQRNRLDPYAVAGLIRQESFFNPTAVSPVGALGLMQVMPQTAAGVAPGVGIRNFSPEMLRDPEINVRIGTRFLASQMARWDGRLSDVYAAYNAGPNRVARWRQLPEHRDDELYVERIPLAEPRDYVKRVRTNGEIYRRLYAPGE